MSLRKLIYICIHVNYNFTEFVLMTKCPTQLILRDVLRAQTPERVAVAAPLSKSGVPTAARSLVVSSQLPQTLAVLVFQVVRLLRGTVPARAVRVLHACVV